MVTIASWVSPPPPNIAAVKHTRNATQPRVIDAAMNAKDCIRALSSSCPSSNRPNPRAKKIAAIFRSIDTEEVRVAINKATGAARTEMRYARRTVALTSTEPPSD